ncbi:MAG: hypothetical protein P1U41_08525 [Vicingaceae bacterium]|nr:hypothetical protein [Vicingaceae bacterium]
MKKALYLFSLLFGLSLFIYFYLFNFDNMSETRLVEVVLYWYSPLAFGLYGLIALRISNTIGEDNDNAIKHLFSGDDYLMLPITIILFALSGIIGALFFFVPLAIFKVKRDHFDIYVASFGTIFFIALLYLFLVGIFPSL